jgi:hypothetical protein
MVYHLTDTSPLSGCLVMIVTTYDDGETLGDFVCTVGVHSIVKG